MDLTCKVIQVRHHMFQHGQKTWVLLLNGASALAQAPLPQVPYSPIYVFFSLNVSWHLKILATHFM